jgi:RND family efflux transporter MFP subunit
MAVARELQTLDAILHRQEESMKPINSITLFPGLFVVALLPGCSEPAQASVPHPIPVQVEAVETSASAGTSRYSGSLEPRVRVDLAFRVGGYVAEVAEIETPEGKRPLDKGDHVKKGTIVARIRAADYAEKARTADAQVAEARAQHKLAELDLERAHRLYEGKAISKAELDSRVARAESAKSSLDSALGRSGEIGVALTDTVLRAPMDGVVLSRAIELGALVSPGQHALTLADTREMKAVFGVPQVVVERLQVGSPLSVFVGAQNEALTPEKLLDARVARIAPAADSAGRVFSIEAYLPNPDGALRSGSVISVRVPDAGRTTDGVVVPLRSVIRSPRDNRSYSVFVLEGDHDRGRTRLRDVRLGEVTGNGVTVTEGLRQSERVVTLGATLLRDGSEAVVIR